MITNTESSRLGIMDRLKLVESGPNAAFDRITQLAQRVFDVPIAIVSALDAERQWFLSRCGLEVESTPREQAFCEYTMQHDSVFVVPDARADRRFASNPLVTGQPHIRFYAGAPLTLAPDLRLGSLCVIDTQPRDFSPNDMHRLASLAALIVGEIWLNDLERDARLDQLLPQAIATKSPSLSEGPSINGAHVRAARGLLNWSLARFAQAANVSSTTLKRIESSEKPLLLHAKTEQAIRRVCNEARVLLVGDTHMKLSGAVLKND